MFVKLQVSKFYNLNEISPADTQLGLYYDRNAPFLKTPWTYTGHTIGKGKPQYNYDLTYETEEGIPSDTSGLPWNVEGTSSMPYKIGDYNVKGKKGNILAQGYVGQGEVDISDMTLDEARNIGREDDWWRMEKGDVYMGEGDEKIQPDLTDEEKIIATKSYNEGPDKTLIQDEVVVNPNEETRQAGKEFAPAPGIKDTDTLDIEALVNKYYDKEGSLGQAQLGLAGQILKAGFQPKKEAMGTLGDAMGAFGTSIQKDKDAMKKLAATGEIQRELYRMSRAEEGKQDRETLQFKKDIKEIDEDDTKTDEQKYLNYKGSFASIFKRPPTGQEHKQMIANFDKDLAGKSIVLSPQKKRDGKTLSTILSPGDQKKLTNAAEGTPIIIGEQIFVKDSDSADGTGMTEVSTLEELKTFNQIKKSNAGSKLLSAAGV